MGNYGGREITEMVSRFPSQQAFAFISQGLCVSGVKIHAKQSQFPGDQSDDNYWSENGLYEKHMAHALEKTKPISKAGVRCHALDQVGGRHGGLPLQARRKHSARGVGTASKAWTWHVTSVRGAPR